MAKDKLKEGDPAPEFRVTTDSGRQVSLSGYRGRRIVVFFYPKANTPG